MKHTTTLGHLPPIGAVSWACTCGATGVLTYAPSTPPSLAVRLMAANADDHCRDAALKEDTCNPE